LAPDAVPSTVHGGQHGCLYLILVDSEFQIAPGLAQGKDQHFGKTRRRPSKALKACINGQQV
jgi:hypothetical protein